ncbi:MULTISPECIES: YkvA family protein [Myroides]|uniref:YkvA family protein n=1 Tax=Myroides TaxID=76831 RepID=UPI00257546CF|nr:MULTISPECIES: DUF1232 domain-containing protein [Myroides]MDM1377665.1 DUF1232 domain-containing protein [Myroides marinus]MDM1385131.1 DUF1232 domain-containing protein [Myroides marinus]MDM1392149.1 DUF1232 domain-containing protein [Myroides marinus]MEC4028564.1 DUF1232 domain-containing protein [Myroides odoratimimus]
MEEKNNKTGALIVGALGLLYGISPIDLVPDVIPVAGWLDDLVIAGGAILHVAEAYLKDYSRSLASLVKMVKWMVWILGGILVLIMALFGVALYSLFTN